MGTVTDSSDTVYVIVVTQLVDIRIAYWSAVDEAINFLHTVCAG